MKTGIFGGSFDPIHNGHIQLAEAFVRELSLDRLFIIPTYIPPHKQREGMAEPRQRLEMCRLAFENSDVIEISDIEIKRKGASYTYLTLRELRDENKNNELFLLTGADMFMTIQDWKHPEVIFESAVICAIPRNDDNIEVLKKQGEYLDTLGARTIISDTCVAPVSSTQIRTLVSERRSISKFVPRKVEEYIFNNGLYL